MTTKTFDSIWTKYMRRQIELTNQIWAAVFDEMPDEKAAEQACRSNGIEREGVRGKFAVFARGRDGAFAVGMKVKERTGGHFTLEPAEWREIR